MHLPSVTLAESYLKLRRTIIKTRQAAFELALPSVMPTAALPKLVALGAPSAKVKAWGSMAPTLTRKAVATSRIHSILSWLVATHSSRVGRSRSCREQASIRHGCVRLAKDLTLHQPRMESIVIIVAVSRWLISSCSRQYSNQRCQGRIADRTWVAIRSARRRIMTERTPKKTSERTD